MSDTSATAACAASVARGVRPRPWLPLTRRELAAFSGLVMEALGLGDMAVEVSAVDDREMARMHRQFLGRTGPTNVLSFPADEEEGDDGVGLVVVSGDAVCRESRLYGQDPLEHMTRLLAHAFLHLAGMTHGPDMEAVTEAAVAAVAAGHGPAHDPANDPAR